MKTDQINISRYLWDYRITPEDFSEILSGNKVMGRLDRDWAVIRLLNYATWEEIVHLVGYKDLVNEWSRWKPRVRSTQCVRGFDYLAKWLPEHHPELLADG